jgi:hypothetical protein
MSRRREFFGFFPDWGIVASPMRQLARAGLEAAKD